MSHTDADLIKDPHYVRREEVFEPSTLENIDTAMFRWLDETLDLRTYTNKGWKKTPVIWVTAERAFHAKRDKDLRDNDGLFILPVVTLERTSMQKSLTKKGSVYAHLPHVERS